MLIYSPRVRRPLPSRPDQPPATANRLPQLRPSFNSVLTFPSRILITGGAGFLGLRLARTLLAGAHPVTHLLLVDQAFDQAQVPADPRVRTTTADLAQPGEADRILADNFDAIVHLAAVVSSAAEANFDLGWRVNWTATHLLLEAARARGQRPRFVFSSSVAVFGGELPAVVTDSTAAYPASSYGAQKAAAELLVADFSRRGYVDGRVLRLPTVAVRPGRPNLAASSFVSSIIREPLQGEPAICPVDPSLRLWISSPATTTANFLRALELPAEALRGQPVLNLPGITVTVAEMLAALGRVAGPEAVARVRFVPNEGVQRIVASWPAAFEVSRALALGFSRDENIDALVRAHAADHPFTSGAKLSSAPTPPHRLAHES